MARCSCAKNCNCFVLDDGYDGFLITNNSTTMASGIGTENNPFFVEDINNRDFVPPAARVRTNTPTPVGATHTVSFTIVDINTVGMFNPNTPNKLALRRPGIYLVGFSVTWNTTALFTPLEASISSSSGFEFRASELSDGTAMTTTGSGIVILGNYVELNLLSPQPGASSAMLWAVYS